MIRKLLQFLFGWPHDHDWELLHTGTYERWNEPNKTGKQVVVFKCVTWLYRCKSCGEENKLSSSPDM